MTRKAGNMIKGIGMGVAVGCVAGAAGAMMAKKHKKGIKKTLGKAMKNVGNLMDDVNGMF